MKRTLLLCWLICTTFCDAQITKFPYSENFDSVVPPSLPLDWVATGFTVSTSSPHSSPNCIYTTGNTRTKTLTSPPFDFTNKSPNQLVFYERRSSTALSYRLEVRAAINDTNFNYLLARFDTSSSTTGYVQRVVDLSTSELAHASNVRLRWILLNDSTNSTGAFRIDDISLTVKIGTDVAVSSLTVAPPHPSRTDSVTLSLLVKNHAEQIPSFPLNFYLDNNQNKAPETDELVRSIIVPTLLPDDSLIVSTTLPPLKVGTYQFFAISNLPDDENPNNDTAAICVTIGQCRNDVLINEFLYAPAGDEDEWIELFNPIQDTINLKGWKISDNNTATKATICTTDYFLPPQSYLVLCKDPGFFDLHPGIPALRVSFSALNNTTSDAIVLFDDRNCVIDSLRYEPSWGGKNGKSLERIDIEELSTEPSNWRTSDSAVGTPGIVNSVARKNYDLAITNASAKFVSATDSYCTINCTVKNFGRFTRNNILLKSFILRQTNSDYEWEELNSVTVQSELAPKDSVSVQLTLQNIPYGERQLKLTLVDSLDERQQNNFFTLNITIPYPLHNLIINEIMFDPPEGLCEWIEIFNRSSLPVDLHKWFFADRPTSSGNKNSFIISDTQRLLQPDQFAIVAADSSIFQFFPSLLNDTLNVITRILNKTTGFSFNNDSDAVILYDLTGKTIDSIAYKASWTQTKHTSLERISTEAPGTLKANWGSPENSLYGTPGFQNTIAQKKYDIAITSLSVLHTNGHPSLQCVIHNFGKELSSPNCIRCYADSNENSLPESNEILLTLPLQYTISPDDSLQLLIDLPNIGAGSMRIIVFIEDSLDERMKNNYAAISLSQPYPFHSLVINEIMFDPLTNQNEWIELYNRSSFPINLKNWRFSDAPTSSGNVNTFRITDTSLMLLPEEYLAIAADSSILTLFQFEDKAHLRILNRAGGFSLGNDSDAVIVVDQNGCTIDSVFYFSAWHHSGVTSTKGRSLERINSELDSNDPRNWGTSAAIEGGTPCSKNSISLNIISNDNTLTISPNPFSPDGDGFEDYCGISFRFPVTSVFVTARIFDIRGRLIITLANHEFRAGSDMLIWNGLDEEHRRVRIGVYIVLIEASDPQSNFSATLKKPIVVATKL